MESTRHRGIAGDRRTTRGRFAPTPNGPLHLGSVVAALASFLSARRARGEWHVRIDDVDVARTVPGAADAILFELERLALPWDGPVVRQRDNTERYRAALATLAREGRTFGCACSRREAGPGPYPGTCRNGSPGPARSIRMRADCIVAFRDRVQGDMTIDLAAETGDFIVHRADRVHAYHLAAAVDDGALGVTEIVRGADLLASTGPQLHVQRALGLPGPAYAHVPVATTAAGAKLAKSSAARPSAERPAADVLRRALAFLGHAPPGEIEDPAGLVDWGVRSWDCSRVPRVRKARVE
ncbi:MAG: tRNA glutamyl-Q(34) synthetase GluQRS [Immundisolibacterales bacterium]|nr:tRNA glutamyl-Q(34) synthetase GluQRS [Immundisolibacterales bacterium]